MTQDVTPGARIGAYTIGTQLNHGGMGMVFQAQKRLDNGEVVNVAIKFPRLSVVHDEEVIRGFFHEAETMSKFRSSRIPKIDTWGIHDGLPYVVMELLSGVSLSQFLDKLWESGRSLNFELAAHILREVALALNYAHTFSVGGRRMNILHRDMAAKNVMLDGAGDVYLIDFGVVRTADTQQEGISSASIVKGTLNYLAPEHAAGEPCAASDVFGLHTMLWEMLEGRTFRQGRTERQLWADALQGFVPPITRADVPPFLTELLERGLHADPERRIKLTDAIALLEEHSRPRTFALKGLFARLFERIARRSGSTIVDGQELPSELLKTMAAAKAVQTPLVLERSKPREARVSPPLPAEPPGPTRGRPRPRPDDAAVSEPLPGPGSGPVRTPTDPGIPLALLVDEDERPPPPKPPTGPVVASTALLDPLQAVLPLVDDERGYTVPLMEALPERPEPVLKPVPERPKPAPEPLPGIPLRPPPSTQPELRADTAPAPSPDTRFHQAPRRRWPLFAGGAVMACAMAGVAAFVIIDAPAQPRESTNPGAVAKSSPVARPQAEEPAPREAAVQPLRIPASPERQPEPAPLAKLDVPPIESPAQAQPEPESDPTPKPPSGSSAEASRTRVTLRPGFSAAEIRIGEGKVLDLSKTRTLKIRTGSVTLRWRFPPATAWNKKTLRLRPGRAYVILVERGGVRVQRAKP